MREPQTQRHGMGGGWRGPRRWIAAVAVIGLAAGLFVLLRPQAPKTPEEGVMAALTLGEQAAEAHNIPALMSLVSKDYKDDLGFNRDRLRVLAIQSFREQSSTFVQLDSVSVQPSGDTARVDATVSLEAQMRNSNEVERGTYPVTLHFRKEPGYKFLIIPTETWRVVKIEGTGFGGLTGDLLDL
jgi:ketosteroid isomerase-like protein